MWNAESINRIGFHGFVQQDAVEIRPIASPKRMRSCACSSPPERRFQVGDQIHWILDPDREAQQVGWSRAVAAFDRGAVLDQALDTAKRGRPLPHFDPGSGGDSGVSAATKTHAQ